MVPQPLPALHQTEVAYHAIMSAAHPCEPHILEPTHDASMHWHVIVSNLDVGRIKIDFRFVHRPRKFVPHRARCRDVLPLTPFRSQRTNRNRTNRRARTLNISLGRCCEQAGPQNFVPTRAISPIANRNLSILHVWVSKSLLESISWLRGVCV